VQWSDAENAGFSTGKPWIDVNPNYTAINVARQEEDPDSVLNFYRKAIALRKSLSCVRHGSYREFFRHSSKHYVYARQDDRQKLLVVCSFCRKQTKFKAPKGFYLPGAELILGNYENPDPKVLQPYECRVYLWK
jgi:glycosidase